MINLFKKQKFNWLPIAPLVYLFVSIFFLRSDVTYFYAASLLLVVVMAWGLKQRGWLKKSFAYWLIVLGAIGLVAAVVLTIEKIEVLTEPTHITSCTFNPIVSCSPVISSDQASAFGFPNPIIGIFGFGALLTAGMTMIAGAKKLARAWWLALLAGTIFGSGFSIWLINEALFDIVALCLYCMAVWLVSFAAFWLTLDQVVRQKHLNLGRFNAIAKRPERLIAISYVIVFGLIFFRWSEFWLSLF